MKQSSENRERMERIDTDEQPCFERWLGRVESAERKKRNRSAAAAAQTAAHYLEYHHLGFFTSLKLEIALGRLSPPDAGLGVRETRPGTRRRVLHVLTQAHAIGGHTRLVWRLIDADPNSEHWVVLTQQMVVPVPPELGRSVERSGGQLLHLVDTSDLCSMAVALRRIANGMDLVFLHIHPFDVIPLIAWGNSAGHPPIALMNHADHVFWLGATVADLVVNIRQSGRQVSIARRGVPELRTAILPIPLVCRPQFVSRQQARKALSLEDDELVALTIASKGKFVPYGDVDFCAVHKDLLQKLDRLRILVVGPDSDEPYWRHWAEKTQGRIRAFGRQSNTSNWLGAADIYLDSFPFASLTSLLEAVLAGVPTLAWHPYPPGDVANVMSVDDLALDNAQVIHSDRADYLCAIENLLANKNVAWAHSQNCRSMVLEVHASPKWSECFERVCSRTTEMAALRPHSLDLQRIEPPGLLDELLRRQKTEGYSTDSFDERYFSALDWFLYLSEEGASARRMASSLVRILSGGAVRRLESGLLRCGQR